MPESAAEHHPAGRGVARAPGRPRAGPTAPGAAGLLPHLQRAAGNQAVGRLIQRKIGFELETRIPVYFEDPPGYLKKAEYDTINADVGDGYGSKFVVDKDGTNSIVELSTGPVEDDQKDSAFKATARTWVALLTSLRDDALATPPVQDLSGFVGTAPADARYGFNGPPDQGEANKLAYQVTHGLALELVPEYLKKVKYKQKPGGRFDKKEEALHETVPAVDALVDGLMVQSDPTGLIAKKSDRKKAVAELRGFLALPAHYLLLGGKHISAYLKNQLSLFYKSKLSDVRNNLVGVNAWADAALNDDAVRGWIKGELLNLTGRTANEKVLTGSKTKCGDWLDAILTGGGDPLFDEAKNDWGKPIDPGTVGGKPAVVLEHRDLVLETPPEKADLNRPEKVVDYLVATFKANKKAQKL
jgi:hypothetical protein